MTLRRRASAQHPPSGERPADDPAAAVDPGGYPAPPADPLAITPGEDPFDYLQRHAGKLVERQVRQGLAGDGKAARWAVERSGTVVDRISTPMSVTPEDLTTPEGVSRTLVKLAAAALNGTLGLSESRKATELVKESSEAMFVNEIADLKTAIDRAKRLGRNSIRAIDAETVSAGAISADQADSNPSLSLEHMAALPSPIIDAEPVPAPAWGRFARETST